MNIPARSNKSQVKANYLYGLSNKKLWIILLLVNVFAMPYGILSIFLFGESNILGIVLTVFSMIINMLVAIVIPFMRFDYYYDKTKVDMAYALPLTRKQKFTTEFFAGLSQYLGGYLIQIILSCIATAIVCITGPNKQFKNSYYANRWLDLGDSWIWNNVLQILFIVMLIQICLYVVTCFVIACTGAIFEAISATIYTNILIPTTIYVVYVLCAERLFGMDFSSSFLNFAYRTSPLGGFLYLVTGEFYREGMISWLIPYCITIFVFFVLTYFIMTRRKAESVGKAFVVRPFYYIILFSVMLHIGVIVSFTDNSLISFVITTLICYFVIELITNRGFKKIGQSIARYAIVIASVLIIIFTIQKTNCFGIAFHVAESEDVEKITISYAGLFNNFYISDIEITSRNSIETILGVQAQLIEDYKESSSETDNGLFGWTVLDSYGPSYSYTQSLRMTVYKKGGSSYERYYSIPLHLMNDLVPVELSEEYIDHKVDAYLNSATHLVVEDVYGINQKTIVNGYNNVNIYQEQSPIIKEFFEALRNDLKNVSLEEYLTPKETTKYRINTDEGRIYILDSYTNSIAFLEKYNAIPVLTEEDYNKIITDSAVELYGVENNYDKDDVNSYSSTSSYYYSYDHINMISSFDDNVQKLLEVAQAQYMTDQPSYKLVVYGEQYIIPMEYSDLAETVINNNTIPDYKYYK